MTKEKQYKELSKLFPSELAVGDVVVIIDKNHSLDWEYKYCFNDKFAIMLFSIKDNQHYHYDLKTKDKLKLKIKNISLSMVLEAMNKKDVVYIISFGDGDRTLRLFINHKYYEWQLRKDGKDVPLYDQSEETIKFIWEVLK